MATAQKATPHGPAPDRARETSGDRITRPLWLYDGDCGLCEVGSARIRRVADPPVDMAPYQSVDLEALGVNASAVLDGPVLCRPDGTYLVGPEAMGTMLSMSRRPFSLVGRTMLAPGVRHGLRQVGPRLYRARHHVPGVAGSCEVPSRPEGPPTSP